MSSNLTLPHVDRSAINFADIAAPITPDQFFARYWTREAVLMRSATRDFAPFCGWNAVNAILNAGDCTFPQIKVSRRDAPLPPETFTTRANGQQIVDARAVVDLFREGASFGITGADSRWPPLRPVVDCFQEALLESVHTNIYCSPQHTQGFQCHYDLHEVFVLQVDGTKHWRVFRPLVENPVVGWRPDDVDEVLATDPYVDVVLQTGDVLYVPRGHWHYAIAEDSMSLHVTVGITCRKSAAFLDWLVNELAEEETWRKNAPLLTGAETRAGGRPPEGFAAWAAEAKQSLMDKLEDPTLFRRFLRDTVRGLQPVHTIELPVQGRPEALPADRFIFERPLGRCHAFERIGPTEVVVGTAGSDIQLDGVNPAIIQQIFASDAFTLADIKAWDPTVDEGVADLLTELVRLGLLTARPII